jgi:hypothetical protein
VKVGNTYLAPTPFSLLALSSASEQTLILRTCRNKVSFDVCSEDVNIFERDPVLKWLG